MQGRARWNSVIRSGELSRSAVPFTEEEIDETTGNFLRLASRQNVVAARAPEPGHLIWRCP